MAKNTLWQLLSHLHIGSNRVNLSVWDVVSSEISEAKFKIVQPDDSDEFPGTETIFNAELNNSKIIYSLLLKSIKSDASIKLRSSDSFDCLLSFVTDNLLSFFLIKNLSAAKPRTAKRITATTTDPTIIPVLTVDVFAEK
jgi:hypothetical protein